MPDGDRHQLGPLLLQSRAGDAGARNRLLAGIRPFLQALIRSWIGPDLRGKLLDSDVVQETLLRIDQHLHEFNGEEPGRFLAWARTIAFHAAIDCKSRLGRAQDGSGQLHEAAAPGLTPLETVEHADDVLHLLAALDQLPVRRRDVLIGLARRKCWKSWDSKCWPRQRRVPGPAPCYH
jgi:RNA polymerase sigma factor (sigma-70 family)